jgi:ABC-2 type transport system ATP-binding protein
VNQNQSVIELEGLEVSLAGRPVLRGLDVNLRGRAIGLLGPNGAGKTTLLATLLGFVRPSAGVARLLGRDVVAERGKIREIVGLMPERDGFVSGMSAVAMVRMLGELSGMAPREALERAHEALTFVGLGQARYRPVETYSLGMKQMVKLAQAIVHGPKVLFLDEPTNGLDPEGRQRMLELIRSVRDSGETRVVMSSHLLRDVETCCDEVVVLREGRIAVACDLEAERRAGTRLVLVEVRGDDGVFAERLVARGCEVAIQNRRRLRVALAPGFEIADLFAEAEAAGIQVRRVEPRRTSLEDIFMRAMEENHGAA